MDPTTGGHHPLSSAPQPTLPDHGAGCGDSIARGFLISLSGMFSPPAPLGDAPESADPWFDYLVDYAQVGLEMRRCHAVWDGLLRMEHRELEIQSTDLRDSVRRVVRARREIMEVLHRDVKRQADAMRTLLSAEDSVMDDMPTKEPVARKSAA